MRNLPEFVVAFWGAALNGAIVVPLNSWWTGAELDYALRGRRRRGRVRRRRAARPRARRRSSAGVRLVGVRTDGADRATCRSTSWSRGAPIDPSTRSRSSIPTTRSTILYTSGTTGRPKGALGTNRATIANIWNMAFVRRHASRSSPGASPRPAAPAGHARGRSRCSTSAAWRRSSGARWAASKIVIMRKWDVDEAMRLAVRGALTGLGGVPHDRPARSSSTPASRSSISTSGRSRWAARRCRPTCRCARSRCSATRSRSSTATA